MSNKLIASGLTGDYELGNGLYTVDPENPNIYKNDSGSQIFYAESNYLNSVAMWVYGTNGYLLGPTAKFPLIPDITGTYTDGQQTATVIYDE